jgi:hypothetical protein
LAREKSQTKSEVIREALEKLAERESRSDGHGGPYEAMKDLIGIVRGGPRDLSIQTGKRFKERLKPNKRGRP